MEGSTASSRAVGDYMLHERIGSGSFADVWRAEHRVTRNVVAIKEIATDRLNRKLRQSLESEVSILKRISHRNIVQLHTVIEMHNKLYLVMEYCAGGDLAGFIRKHRRISEEAARPLLQQLAAGLQELWSHHLVHRDLKPQNLLLTGSGPDAVLKIADFGFARDLQPQGLAETLCGSPLYMAPEILKFFKYDAKADLWSVGTILYELVVGRPPFNGINHVQLLHNIERSEARLPADVAARLSTHAVALITQLLKRNSIERISFEEFFTHPFLGLQPAAAAASAASATTHASMSHSTLRHHHPSPHIAHTEAQGLPDSLPFVMGPAAVGGQEGASREHMGAVGPVVGSPIGAEIPTARFVPSPTLLLPPSEGGSRGEAMRASSSSMRSAQMVHPLMDSVLEEDDYVIVDPAPSPSSSGQTSRSSSFHHSGNATPHRGLAHQHSTRAHQQQQQQQHMTHQHISQPLVRLQDPQPTHIPLPRTASGQQKLPAATPPALIFTLGVSRVEALRKVARLLDAGLPDLSQAAEQLPDPGAAVVLRILALQVLGAALDACRRDPAVTLSQSAGSQTAADVITDDMRCIVARADEAGQAVAVQSQGSASPRGLPDVWELVFQGALALARCAAVDELLGATSACLRAYSRAAALFYFMFAEAPNLPLQPPLILSPQDVYRLQKYTASIAFRYQTAASGAAASAASNGSGIAQLPVTSPAAASTTRDAAAGPAPAAAAIATQ